MVVIERIGYGRKQRFIIRRRQGCNGLTAREPGTAIYKTEQAAREAAAGLGLTVESVGDIYQIIK